MLEMALVHVKEYDLLITVNLLTPACISSWHQITTVIYCYLMHEKLKSMIKLA